MSREIRRVPSDWDHPKDGKGYHIPLYPYFPYTQGEVEDELRRGLIQNDPPHYGCPTMSHRTRAERTHFQMYDTLTFGTPMSPVFATREELARWLADNKASVLDGTPSTYEEWISSLNRGWPIEVRYPDLAEVAE